MKRRSLEELPGTRRPARKSSSPMDALTFCMSGTCAIWKVRASLAMSLVVAINSDRSVRALKGPGRPILNENERVALVSALRCVDHVVVFDEPDVSRVIDTLRPAVHAKGTDYTEATVPEREQVLAYGGQVRIAGDPKDHSTRDVIRKIIETYGEVIP